MSEYQAVYDAVRSRISGGNIAGAVETAMRDSGISHAAEMVRRTFQHTAYQYERPSVLYRPSLAIDGNKWSALYGSNIQEGVVGYGDSPEDAMRDFDTNWHKKLPVKCERCDGTGALDAPFSGSDPSCPDCSGEGKVWP